MERQGKNIRVCPVVIDSANIIFLFSWVWVKTKKNKHGYGQQGLVLGFIYQVPCWVSIFDPQPHICPVVRKIYTYASSDRFPLIPTGETKHILSYSEANGRRSGCVFLFFSFFLSCFFLFFVFCFFR